MTNLNKSKSAVNVGVDVWKFSLDIYIYEKAIYWHDDNSACGIKRILKCNPVIRAFYNQLVAQGKHKKVALTTCMRKFIIMLNAMVRDRCEWAY